jgi:non-ribosomal peptide synthetase component F
MAGPAASAELGWWRERLEGAPAALALPVDRPRPAEPRFAPGYHNVRLPEPLGGRVKALAQRAGATLYMTVLAAFAALLGHDAGTPDVLVVTPIAGRTESRWEPLIGFFVNRIVVRVDLGGDPSFAELLGRVRRSAAEAFAHQRLPFEPLVDHLTASLGDRAPALPVMLSLQNTPQGGGGLAGVDRVVVMPDDSGRDFTPILELYSPLAGRFELSLVLRERADGVAGGLEYNAELFDPATVAALDARLAALLEAAVADPDRRLSALGAAVPEAAGRPA